MRKVFFSLFFILILTSVSNAATIRSVVDKTTMSQDETLTLTVVINNGKADIDVSGIADFQIVSKSSGSNYQWINGKTINEYKLTYILVPLKKGRLFIPSLKAVIKGRVLTTKPLNINVSDRPVSAKDRRDVFVTAVVSNKKPFESQQILYTFSLYYAVNISGLSLQTPDFKGFNANEIEKDITKDVVVGGRQYKVIEKRIILIPVKTGDFTIPPAVLNCNVPVKAKQQRRDSFNSFFDDSFFSRSRMQRKVLRTNALAINVQPLPEYPHGFNFSGVVGKVKMRAVIENSNLKTGDSTNLTIVVEGTGNIMDVEEPKVRVPSAFKVYKDNPEDVLKTGRDGFYGKKTFSLAIVAVEAGDFQIPVIEFGYFDTGIGQYKVQSAGPFNIKVFQSALEKNEIYISPNQNGTGLIPGVLKKKVEYTGHDLLPLKEDLDAVNNIKTVPYYLFIILLLIPVIITGIIKLILIFTQRDETLSSLMQKRADASLKNAAKKELSEEAFLSNIYKAFVSKVFATAAISGETLTTHEAGEILKNAGYNEDLVNSAQQFIERLESIRFSGRQLNEDVRNELLNSTRQLFRKLK